MDTFQKCRLILHESFSAHSILKTQPPLLHFFFHSIILQAQNTSSSFDVICVNRHGQIALLLIVTTFIGRRVSFQQLFLFHKLNKTQVNVVPELGSQEYVSNFFVLLIHIDIANFSPCLPYLSANNFFSPFFLFIKLLSLLHGIPYVYTEKNVLL